MVGRVGQPARHVARGGPARRRRPGRPRRARGRPLRRGGRRRGRAPADAHRAARHREDLDRGADPVDPARPDDRAGARGHRAALRGRRRCPTGPGCCGGRRGSRPHHSASAASVLGGGTGRVRPGQVSLAHHGVLFLDEFPHFRADVIEAMRQPLESGEVTIARGEESATYPARSLVVLAANPCPCGNFHGRHGRGVRLHRGPACPLPAQAVRPDRRPRRHLDGGATAGPAPVGRSADRRRRVVGRRPCPGHRGPAAAGPALPRLRLAAQRLVPGPGRSPSAGRWSPRDSADRRASCPTGTADPARADPRPAARVDRRRLRRRRAPREPPRPRSPWPCAPTTPPREPARPGWRHGGSCGGALVSAARTEADRLARVP